MVLPFLFFLVKMNKDDIFWDATTNRRARKQDDETNARLSHGATWKSVKHFVTEVGEPVYETWLEYPNYTAIDEDEEISRGFAQNPEFLELISPMSTWFQRVNSRIMKEI